MAASRPFNIEDDVAAAIGLGLIKNVRSYDIFGARVGLERDVESDISHLNPPDIPLANAAGEQMQIVSSDPGDDQFIEIEALGPDAVSLEKFQVQLNGTAPVLLPEPLVSRINEAENVSTTPFAGSVDIQSQGGATNYGTLRALDQQMNQAVFTVPKGRKWLVKKLICTLQRSGGADNDVTAAILFKRFDGSAWRRPFSFGLQRSGSTIVDFTNAYPNVVEGPVDIKVVATPTATGTSISAFLNGLLL